MSFATNQQALMTRLTALTKFGNSATFSDIAVVTFDRTIGQLVGDVAAGSFTIGITYEIVSVGTTNFTLIGAASNTVGVQFVATGAGIGTGTGTAPTILATTVGGPIGVNPRLINGTTIQETDQTIIVEASRLTFTISIDKTKVTIDGRKYAITSIKPSRANDVTIAYMLVIR